MIKELAHYFINQGIHVVALTPKKKYPNYKAPSHPSSSTLLYFLGPRLL